jgi:N-acetylglucosaminyldiphosphoundecaprenol N-acetyl-beta-D-mannosaminyltransferase
MELPKSDNMVINYIEELNSRKRNLLGLPIHDLTMEEVLSHIEWRIKESIKTIIFGISAGAYGRLKFRKDLVSIYKKMDIIIAEGGGIPLLGKIFGVKIREHIGLVNLMFHLIELSHIKKYKVLLFGASQEVNDKASDIIRQKYPGIQLCNGINGYFKEEDEIHIVQKINKEDPDILFIGITYPIKERFAIKYKDRLNTKIIVPCGGAFDVLVGKAKRPPVTFKWIPVTWLYRFIQEPKRLFKQVLITVLYSVFWVFPILYLKHILRIERNPSIVKFFNLNGA